jgi:hypothetical protein
MMGNGLARMRENDEDATPIGRMGLMSVNMRDQKS